MFHLNRFIFDRFTITTIDLSLVEFRFQQLYKHKTRLF